MIEFTVSELCQNHRTPSATNSLKRCRDRDSARNRRAIDLTSLQIERVGDWRGLARRPRRLNGGWLSDSERVPMPPHSITLGDSSCSLRSRRPELTAIVG